MKCWPRCLLILSLGEGRRAGAADEWSAAAHPWALGRCKRIQLNVGLPDVALPGVMHNKRDRT